MLNFLIVILLFSMYQPLFPQKEAKKIYTGYSIGLFNDVDIRDATVAVKMWADELLKNMYISISPQSVILNSNQEIIDELNKNQLDIISLSFIEYLQIKNKVDVVPTTLTMNDGKIGYQFILVVRKDKKINKLSDLKGLDINITKNTMGLLIKMWLTTSVSKMGNDYDSFFNSVKEVEKPSQALLPVFFNQVDACVISATAYKTMKELNPQLENELMVIDESPTLINGLMCINNSVSKELKKAIEKSAMNIVNSKSGRQILYLFKSENLIHYDEKYTKNTVKLYNDYLKATNKKQK